MRENPNMSYIASMDGKDVAYISFRVEVGSCKKIFQYVTTSLFHLPIIRQENLITKKKTNYEDKSI